MNAAKASINEGQNNYYILQLMTDGDIDDFEDTKVCLVDSARLPISIIIIGIGEGPFDKMNELDGDHGLKDKFGREAERDLVQFVEFDEF